MSQLSQSDPSQQDRYQGRREVWPPGRLTQNPAGPVQAVDAQLDGAFVHGVRQLGGHDSGVQSLPRRLRLAPRISLSSAARL